MSFLSGSSSSGSNNPDFAAAGTESPNGSAPAGAADGLIAGETNQADLNEDSDQDSQVPPELAAAAGEIESFVASAGWDQPVQLFALASTEHLLANEPGLADQLNNESALTPIAQESLPEGELDQALAQISWPDAVVGCALVQEIVILPPEVEEQLGSAASDDQDLEELALNHPERQEARLVAAVLRDGGETCVLRLRADSGPEGQDETILNDEGQDIRAAAEDLTVVQDPALAPNLLRALHETFA